MSQNRTELQRQPKFEEVIAFIWPTSSVGDGFVIIQSKNIVAGLHINYEFYASQPTSVHFELTEHSRPAYKSIPASWQIHNFLSHARNAQVYFWNEASDLMKPVEVT